MVAQEKGMAGTVVWGVRVLDSPSHLTRSKDKSPKTEVFPLWSPYTPIPTPGLQAVPFPSRDMSGERELIFSLDQLVFSPPPAIANEVPDDPLD